MFPSHLVLGVEGDLSFLCCLDWTSELLKATTAMKLSSAAAPPAGSSQSEMLG